MKIGLKAFWLAVFAVVLVVPGTSDAASAREAVVYKDPSCGCCAEYAKYLDQNGFAVTVVDTVDLAGVKRAQGVPDALAGCHTVLLEGYVVEGHVPVSVLERLLSERPEIKGVSLPGMPPGSPGMGGAKAGPFTIYEFSSEGRPKVFEVE